MEILGPKNARFWAWSNGPEGGWVKLTLKPGQELIHHGGGPCEEGYHYWAETWRHEGDRVLNTWDSQSRDCDGLYHNGSRRYCLVDLLQAVTIQHFASTSPYHPTPPRPAWEHENRTQRDFEAEKAGY